MELLSLFLQAKKDERIAILGNLLGLGIYGVMELDARKKLADARKELASKKEAVRIKTDFIKAQGNPKEELETVEKDIHKKQEELENLDESRRKLLERQEKISEAEKESEKARSELKECSEECSVMEHDLEYSKQTLTACNNLLEMADVIREKAKEYSKLSLQLSDAEKDVIKYKNAKEKMNGYPVPFIIKQLSMKEIKEIRNLYKTTEIFRDKKNANRPVIENGQVVVRKDYDAERAGLHIMVDAFVQPKLDDPELMEFYKVNDRLDMPETLFADRDDFRYANKCVMEACGLAAKRDEEETVKNLKN